MQVWTEHYDEYFKEFYKRKEVLNIIFNRDIANIIIRFYQTKCWDEHCDFHLCIYAHD